MHFPSGSLALVVALELLTVGGVACSASSSTSAPNNGVNDVVKACQLRAPWTSRSSSACTTCVGYASAPRCACADKDFAGKCSDQVAAKNKEATCDGTDACAGKCAPTDCPCVDACYAGKAACRTLASAADGCVADTCDAYCK